MARTLLPNYCTRISQHLPLKSNPHKEKGVVIPACVCVCVFLLTPQAAAMHRMAHDPADRHSSGITDYLLVT